MRLVTPVYTNDRIRVNLKPGDHIFSERGDNVFYHHGIYVGHDRVIHFQGPYKDASIETNPCLICGYAPKREGRLVKTCLDCFCWGHALFVREYGIPVTENTLDPWILERLNSQRVIYTRRYFYTYIGILTDDNMVYHLRDSRKDVRNSPPCPSCGYKPNKEGGFVKTCLSCFLRGSLLFIGEHGIPVCGSLIDDFVFDFCRKKLITRGLSFSVLLYHKIVTELLVKGINVRKFSEKIDDIGVKEYLKVPFFYGMKQFWKNKMVNNIDDSWEKFEPFTIYYDGLLRVCSRSHARARPPNEVVDAANKILVEGFGDYNLIFKNCEHFATFCKTGVAISRQISYRIFIHGYLQKLRVHFFRKTKAQCHLDPSEKNLKIVDSHTIL